MLPANLEAHQVESRRHFNECFSLACAAAAARDRGPATPRTAACNPAHRALQPRAPRPATPRTAACNPPACRWAQQLKNKDIPEGGSKAVCLVTPTAGIERDQLMHGCVKVS